MKNKLTKKGLRRYSLAFCAPCFTGNAKLRHLVLGAFLLQAAFSYAQAPALSYGGAQTYTAGVAITPVVPTSGGVAAQGYSSSPVTVGSGFHYPTGVAVDAAGNVYVADYKNRAVKKIPAGGGAPVTWGSGFRHPYGIAVDAAGNVYVADATDNAVKKIPAGGGAPITIGSGFHVPNGVAVDAAGNVYVADAANNVIKKIPVDGGAPVTLGSGFNNSSGVAVDAAGNVYVGDHGGDAVKKIPAGGGDVTILLNSGLGYPQPLGVAVDAAGILFMTDCGLPGSNVFRFPAGGGTPIGLGGASFLLPYAVAVDGAGNLYVADTGHDVIKEIRPIGGYYIDKALPAGLHFDETTGIISGTPTVESHATDYTVTAYSRDRNASAKLNIKVVALPNDAKLSSLTISSGTLTPAFAGDTVSYTATELNAVKAITLTPTAANANAAIKVNGAVVLSGSASASLRLNTGDNVINIWVTAQDGTSTNTYTVTITRLQLPTLSYSSPQSYVPGFAITPLVPASSGVAALGYSNPVIIGTGFNSPQGVAVDAAGNVYVADYNYRAVKKIPVSGGAPITLGSGFDYPNGIAVDYAGNVYVTNYKPGAVNKIPVGGAPIISVGPSFASAGGVAVDAAGNLYVGDLWNNLVMKIPGAGGPAIPIGSWFDGPKGLAVDAAGNVYVANYFNNTVKKIPVGGGSPVTIGSGFYNPKGVAVDAAGNVYVADYKNSAIKEIPAGGGAILTLAAGLSLPSSVAVDPAGNVYVAEEFENRVKEIKPIGGYHIGPFLPPGLIFNENTGAISGTPTGESPATDYTITAYNGSGSTSAKLNIKVAALPSGAALSSLTISSGTLTPAFAAGTTNYIATVLNAVTTITLTPTADNANATIKVNGAVVLSGSASANLPLNTGDNMISVLVTAQDGTTTLTYTLTVKRAGADATLKAISLSTGSTPTFSGPRNYTASVAPATTSLTLTPTASAAGAAITVNGVPVVSGAASQSIPLDANPTIINIQVTAADSVTKKTYSVSVYKNGSGNAAMKSITLSTGSTLTYLSSSNNVSYFSASVTPATTSLRLTPTASDPTASITVDGVAVTSGIASQSIAINTNPTTITVQVTAQDGTTVRTYPISVSKNGSSNAGLDIALSTGSMLTYLSSANNVNYYSASVTPATGSLTVTPTAGDPNAAITVNGVAVTSGTASQSIALNTNTTVITVQITAQDGVTVRARSITVYKSGASDAGFIISLSTGSMLTYLSSSGNVVLHYSASVSSGTTSLMVTPTASDPNAVITVNGIAVPSGTASQSIALNTNPTIINVQATAQDGVTVRTHSISVYQVTSLQPLNSTEISVTEPADKLQLSDGLMVHQGISPNGDGINDVLTIEGITQYPDNKLAIMNRNGSLVYEAKGYDNSSKVFDGHSNKTWQMQLPGTYFYSLDYTTNGVTKHKTGFIVLKY